MLLQSIETQLPPVLPKEGEVYLFDLGPDDSSCEHIKKNIGMVLSVH